MRGVKSVGREGKEKINLVKKKVMSNSVSHITQLSSPPHLSFPHLCNVREHVTITSAPQQPTIKS
jgi:hypothetical protein